MTRLIKNKCLIAVMTAFMLFGVDSALAQSDQDREKAMQIAEMDIGGKALRAKFLKKRNGYRVRLIKRNSEGKARVVHIFIALEDIQQVGETQ